ncbi:MAG: ribonuclease R [Leptospirales bacterium]
MVTEKREAMGDPLEDRILSYLRDEVQKPVRSDRLIDAVIRKKKERKEIARTLDLMAEQKKVLILQGGYVALPDRLHLRTGVFLAHPDGYGFVVAEGFPDDLFIPASSTLGAMHQDKVLAVLTGKDGRGRTEGQIFEVVSRSRKSVVGTVRFFEGGSTLRPRDPRLNHDFLVVGETPPALRNGDLAVLEITRYPEGGRIPEGHITQSLGEASNPGLDTDLVLATYQLTEKFPDPVEEEAHRVAKEIPIAPGKEREDLRDWTILTIDGDSARDFDDALSLEEKPNGEVEVGIHIADVAAYVQQGGALDREAFHRGTSVYFPDRVVPMFPEVLSNGVLSLNPDEDRLARTVLVRLDRNGAILKSSIFRSVIRSRMRATYSRVHPILAGETPDVPEQKLSPLLRSMWEVARKLKLSRFEQGSLDFDLPEPEIVLDLRGEPIDIIRSPRYLSHQLVEEFMLLANRIVAQELVRKFPVAMFRVHEPPSSEKIEDLGLFLAALGLALPVRKGGGFRTKDLSGILESTRGTPLEKMVHFSVLRSLKQARYDTHPLGHFGLAMEDYTHFTSPIRRYPDLIVHRLLDLPAGSSPAERMWEPLERIANHVSERERVSVDAERMAIDLKRIRFMAQHLGKSFEGSVSGVTGFGFFVELKEILVEGLVPVSSLHDDYYVYDEKRHVLRGESTRRVFRIGDPVKVRVARVDSERLRIEFVIDGEEGLEPRKKSRPGSRNRRGRSGRSGGKK